MQHFSSTFGNDNFFFDKKKSLDNEHLSSFEVTDGGVSGQSDSSLESRDIMGEDPEELLIRSSPLFELVEAAREYVALKKGPDFLSEVLEKTNAELERIASLLSDGEEDEDEDEDDDDEEDGESSQNQDGDETPEDENLEFFDVIAEKTVRN